MPKDTDKVFCSVAVPDYEHNRGSTKIYGYHDYYRPKVEFYCVTDEVFDWQNSLYLGVELEVDSPDWGITHRKLGTVLECEDIMQSQKYGYFMRDGSLHHGMEFITQPSTLAFYQSNREMFSQIFDRLKSRGFEADKMASCGFHIHFNRDFYKDNESKYVENLLFIVDRYWSDLVYCSKRRVSSIIRWSDKYHNNPQEIVERMESGSLRSRYQCVNLLNRDTIEFRLWHGTLDITTFYGILSLVSNIIVMAKTKTHEEILKTPFDMLITEPELAKVYFEALKPQHTKKYTQFLMER